MPRSPREDERFCLLYDQNLAPIRNYCLRRLPRAEVNDAVAEVFVVVWRRIDTAPNGDDARPWLYGIARNVIRNTDRSLRRRTRLLGRLGLFWEVGMRRIGFLAVLALMLGGCSSSSAEEVTRTGLAPTTSTSFLPASTSTSVSTTTTLPLTVHEESGWEGAYVLDDEWRNPKEWSEHPEVFPDSFVPMSVSYGPDGLPVIAYWVGLNVWPFVEEGETLPEGVEEAVMLGAVRLVFCSDLQCLGEVEIVEVADAYWPYGFGSWGAINLALLPDGSPVLTLPGDQEVWDPEALGGDGGDVVEPTRLLVCSNPRCENVTIHNVVDLFLDHPSIPHTAVPIPRVAVSADGLPVLAFTAGTDPDNQSLALMFCGDRNCDNANSTVIVDGPQVRSIGHLWVNTEGQMTARYGNPDQTLAVCPDPGCELIPVPITNEPNDLLITDGSGVLQRWHLRADGSIEVIQCADPVCVETTSTTLGINVPTGKWQEFPEPCRITIGFGNGENPVITWCEFGDLETPRTVTVCDDPSCSSSTEYEETDVNDLAAARFTQIIAHPSKQPSLIIGSDGALLIQPIPSP